MIVCYKPGSVVLDSFEAVYLGPLVAIISVNCPETTILDPLCCDDFQMQLLLI